MVSDAYSSEYMIKTEFPAQGAHGKVVVTSSITVAGRTVNPLVRAGRTSAFFTKGNKANIKFSGKITLKMSHFKVHRYIKSTDYMDCGAVLLLTLLAT